MNASAKKPVTVVLSAIGGYGYHYYKALTEQFPAGAVELTAAVDPAPEKSECYADIKARGIPVYPSMEAFYDRGRTADLAVIVSPIQHHVPQSCGALQEGSHVLCEKPVCATIQEVDRLIESRDASGRWVRIGFQLSYAAAIQNLKKDIMEGRFGRPILLKTLYLWPRGWEYYHRNDWAGRVKDDAGNWILDCPANNAMAHDLHNMLYLLGSRIDSAAEPIKITAECYRAYPIQNYDTVACRIFTQANAELLFYASHATPKKVGLCFAFEFEKATVTYEADGDDIVAKYRNGREEHYGSPQATPHFQKLFEAVAAVKKPTPVLCGPEAARPHTLCVNGIQESAGKIVPFPKSKSRSDEKNGVRWVEGLAETLQECYQKGTLPSESRVSWARHRKTIYLKDYRHFPGGTKPRGKPST
jgi:predicted dehydrogenase